MRGKKCGVHQRHSMILGKSRKTRTFTALDTPRFNDVSGHRIFHAAEKVRFRKNTGPDTRCIYAACPEPDTSPYFRFSKEYGFVSTNIGTMTRLISRSAVNLLKMKHFILFCRHSSNQTFVILKNIHVLRQADIQRRMGKYGSVSYLLTELCHKIYQKYCCCCVVLLFLKIEYISFYPTTLTAFRE